MMIVVEEKLNFVVYANGPGRKHQRIDRLAMELGAISSAFPAWDYELEVPEAFAKIHVSGCERTFIVEGVENLYSVSENKVKWVSKEVLFSEAVDKSIADEFIEIAGLNGYNISIMSCRERVKIAVAMVLRYVENTEQTINIPYPLVRDFSKVCPALDANRIPDKYALDKDDCDRIELALLMVIKDRLGIGHSSAALPLYSFNWFISQSQLGE